MGQDAECYQKTADDRVIILNVRAYYVQPFLAPAWTDLRLGFFLSLCKSTPGGQDNTSGLAEEIGTPPRPFLPWSDRIAIGATDRESGSIFLGFTNTLGPRNTQAIGTSKLVSSDAALGTTNANFWRPTNSVSDHYSAAIFDTGLMKSGSGDGLQQHFPQVPANTGGYAVLLGLQLLRDNTNSKTITMKIKSSAQSADMLYSDTPTKELIQQTIAASWPPSQQLGPVELSHVPNAFVFYWPFQNSRLRVHSIAEVQAE